MRFFIPVFSALTNGHTRSKYFFSFFNILILYFYYYIIFFFYRIQSNGKKNGKKPSEQDPTVKFIPDEICFLMEVSLLSLVGAEKLDKEFCGDHVFSKIRTKFNNALGNAKKVIFFIP